MVICCLHYSAHHWSESKENPLQTSGIRIVFNNNWPSHMQLNPPSLSLAPPSSSSYAIEQHILSLYHHRVWVVCGKRSRCSTKAVKTHLIKGRKQNKKNVLTWALGQEFLLTKFMVLIHIWDFCVCVFWDQWMGKQTKWLQWFHPQFVLPEAKPRHELIW